ncbi:MAG: gliding-motility protein MglA, partial [Planctomycetota bacterium]
MVHINFGTREMIMKIVYAGPSGSGKTAILKYIDQKLPSACKGKLLSISNQSEETIFFDHLPLTLGEVGGLEVKINLY